ncbi:MAG: efflux RND transporter periplasmic adaptor subunit [Acidobacteria bacterium]|nr:efflux RND transporter periplasmic adaptor subunit [Acidobacteriota bacterium]
MRSKKLIWTALISGAFARPALAQGVEMAAVVSKPVSRTITLPGEIHPFLNVDLRSRVPGYVERVLVDRGSVVKAGELLVELSAPEMKAQIAEAESKVQAIEADLLQAQAQLAATQSTYDRMKKAAETPGAIAGNEIIVAEKQVEAAAALINSRKQAGRAAQASVDALKSLEAYLKITAPFDGAVSERIVHPGALVGPGSDRPLLVLQQISRLRLTVAVPEENVGAIAGGANVAFQVPAYPERNFSGTVARRAQALDQKTRTMAVELDVVNSGQSLAPGMYAAVKWPIRRAQPALYVPRTSVVTTTERTFIIREKNGKAEWVNVRKGAADGDMLEVVGELQAGDKVVRRANDEMREGTPLQSSSK